MENPEEILHSLEEFSKTKPKDIPRELEEYLCFVAKTGDPVYQWSAIKSLFREKMINVITEFYEQCPSVEIPPCPNVDLFNYDVMKTFILEKLDTFAAAPFTLQRICELLTTPRKEYNRIDKYMRALEKNILVVSTTEPGGRRTAENGDGIMNGLESEHLPETSNSSDINVEEMDETPAWPRLLQNEGGGFANEPTGAQGASEAQPPIQETQITESKDETACTSSQDTVICRNGEEPYVSIEPVPSDTCVREEEPDEADVSVTITPVPAGVQKRRSSVEPVVSSEGDAAEPVTTDSSDASEKSESAESSPKEPDQEPDPLTEETAPQIDSSSSSKESDKTPDTSSEALTPTESPTTPDTNEVTSPTPEPLIIPETVDTTKCSESKSEEVITSSDKVEEAHSSESEAEAKLDESKDQEAAAKEDVKDAAASMEVDEEYSNSEKVEEVVRAEATSDSPL